MGYFDGLVDAMFKKDVRGRDVFYPRGIMGKGFILPDPASTAAVRAKMIGFYKVLIFVVIPLAIVSVKFLHVSPIAILMFIGAGKWFHERRLTAGYAISDERLSWNLAEAVRRSARSQSYFSLWTRALLNLALLAGSAFFVIDGSPGVALMALISGALFGTFFCLILCMIDWKRRRP
ncbi:MAG TPA: hypothetical protein VMT54_17585 [Candidatus Cybelea sp.]|nr:hypothetical protein [Candidatus Cybelea sp.]